MKLISCHIENFGKFSGADFTFGPGLTSLCRENGYGKTTLAAFLKAMLYGMGSDRANMEFPDRRRFYPFSGGIFGGNAVFEAGGKTYKIERFFDEKSEPKDSLTVYCNGSLYDCGGEEPGKIFLGIDRQSFERTAFISGGDIETSSTGGINSKLNNFAGGMDEADFAAALTRLENKKKEYKKRGGEGLISACKAKKEGLSEEMANRSKIAAGLPAKYAEYESLGKQAEELGKRISEAQNNNVVMANWESYEKMEEENSLNRQRLLKIEQNYPFGIPSADETAEIKRALENKKTAAARLEQSSFTAEDEGKYAALMREFPNGTPTESETEKIRGTVSGIKKRSYELGSLKERELSEKEKALMQKFAYRVPGEEEVRELSLKAESYKKAESRLADLPDYIPADDPNGNKRLNKAKIKYLAIAAAVAFAVAVAGIITACLGVAAAGIAMAAAGGAAGIAAAAACVVMGRAKTGETVPLQKENPQKLAAKRETDNLYDEIRAYLVPWGYSLSQGVPYAEGKFKDDLNSFAELRERTERENKRAEELSGEIEKLSGEAAEFFAAYGLNTGEFEKRAETLAADARAFGELSARKKAWQETESRLKGETEKCGEKILAFCRKYKIPAADAEEWVKTAEKDCSDYVLIKKYAAEGEEKARAFREEKGLGERPEGEVEDLGGLNAQLNGLQEERNRLRSTIAEEESDAEKLDFLSGEYDRTAAELEKLKGDYELLEKAEERLKSADAAIKERYVKPVRDRFLRYGQLLENALGEKIVMAPDFEIRYERCGKERSEKHLSSGMRCMCALCLRLALIDNMYPVEKPFVVLDDPFAGLDEEHLEKAKNLVKALSQRMQIIYFSCHASRAPAQ